eukprot:5170067-Pyramimonas_sp.AAC.1
MAPRSAQEASKGPKMAPRGPQEAPKRIPDGPQRPPRGTHDAEKPLRTTLYSPGRRFWTGRWGCAKRLEFLVAVVQ